MSRLLGEATILETPRLTLRSTTTGDLDAMPWLEGVLGPEATLSDLMRAVRAGQAATILTSDRSPIGLVTVSMDTPVPGGASVPFIAVAPAARFRGLGGEAGLAVDRHLRRLGSLRVFAPVPEARGLAVYFWLRLGFRPLTASEAPWPVRGLAAQPLPGIWMLRDAD